MSDDQMPGQFKTQQLPAADKTEMLLAELKVLMTSGFRAADERFNRQDATLQTLADNDLKSTERMAKFEVRIEDLEQGRTKLSGGVRNLSTSNAEHSAQLVHLTEAVGEAIKKSNESQLKEMVEEIKKAAATPTGKKLVDAGTKLLLVLMTLATLYLGNRVLVMQQQPQTVQVPK